MASKELKVQPAEVKQKAAQMAVCTGQIKNTFNNIKLEVESLKLTWDSEASRAFQGKFNGLQDDIQRMFGVAEEYSEDLEAIANTYLQTESDAAAEVNKLSDDVFRI